MISETRVTAPQGYAFGAYANHMGPELHAPCPRPARKLGETGVDEVRRAETFSVPALHGQKMPTRAPLSARPISSRRCFASAKSRHPESRPDLSKCSSIFPVLLKFFINPGSSILLPVVSTRALLQLS